MELTKEKLISLGYVENNWKDDDGDEVLTWYYKGITLFEDKWSSKPEFSFPSNLREDGTFKSGWHIKTEEQLSLLHQALIQEI